MRAISSSFQSLFHSEGGTGAARLVVRCGVAALTLAAALPGPAWGVGIGVDGPGPGGEAWLSYEYAPRLTVADDPALHEVAPGGAYDGVGRLVVEWSGGTRVGCSGALMPGGRHVLTAAHCLTDGSGALVATGGTVRFEGDAGTYDIALSAFYVHPGWSGVALAGDDVALVELAAPAPDEITRYGLYTGSDEIGQVGTILGYGVSGTGATGEDPAAYPFGTKRAGLNVYDMLADDLLEAFGLVPGIDFQPGAMLAYDFDSGDPANDAFGHFFGLDDTGLGDDEALSASGDSGGPVLIGGLVAGITSYGLRVEDLSGYSTDVNGALDSSFGEIGVDMRVSYYADFIYAVLGAPPSSGGSVPAPAPLALLGAGLAAGALARRRRA